MYENNKNVYFSSDWHLGEEKYTEQGYPTHSYLSNLSVSEKINLCKKLVSDLPENSKIYFLGDAIVDPNYLHVFIDMFKKQSNKIFILGDKEYQTLPIKYNLPVEETIRNLVKGGWEVVYDTTININGNKSLLTHKPLDAKKKLVNGNIEADMVICGHIHGIWRTQKMDIPFLNVGIDAWCNQLVSLEWVNYQYDAVDKGYYDGNCFINLDMLGHTMSKSLEKTPIKPDVWEIKGQSRLGL